MTLTDRIKNRIRFFNKRVSNLLPGLGYFALLESGPAPSPIVEEGK
jgi:hypothetical protein